MERDTSHETLLHKRTEGRTMRIQLTRVTMEARDAASVLASLGPYVLEPSEGTFAVVAITLGTPKTVRRRMARAYRCLTERVES